MSQDPIVVFIGVATSPDTILQINQKLYSGNSRVLPQQTFDFQLAEGLSSAYDVRAISEAPINSFPGTQLLLREGHKEMVNENLSIYYLPIVNISGIKQIVYSISLLGKLLRMRGLEFQRVEIVLGYSSIQTMLPAIIARALKGFRVTLIVPDLPEHMYRYSQRGLVNRVMTSISSKLSLLTQGSADKYVLLTEQMNSLVNKNGRPSLVMEGFIDSGYLREPPLAYEERNASIIYAGSLNRKFGVSHLVEAFLSDDFLRQNYELHIYGEGDYLSELLEIAAREKSLKYMGVIGREDLFSRQRRAQLLVNPRPSDEEFTRYSFPSKTMEYLASGTPVLTTRLSGIPIEYKEILFWIDKESPQGIAQSITKVLQLSEDEKIRRGTRAQEFLRLGKTAERQASRMMDFILDKHTQG